jgi:hypothetical protein
MLSGSLDDRLDPALEMAMIVLMVRSRFSDGGMSSPPLGERALKFRLA